MAFKWKPREDENRTEKDKDDIVTYLVEKGNAEVEWAKPGDEHLSSAFSTRDEGDDTLSYLYSFSLKPLAGWRICAIVF